MDTETKKGKAVLVTVAGPEDAVDVLCFPSSFREVFDFLAGLADRFVCFNMDYDARAWFKFLPPSAWTDLYRYGSILWRGFRIVYVDGKYFAAHFEGRSVTLFDCCQHYQSSLAVAARKSLGKEKLDVPEKYYEDMERFLVADWFAVIAYAIEDAALCRDLWSMLDTQYRELGCDPKSLARPLSPGQIAAGFFGDKIRFRLGRQDNDIAKRGYRGGRIEVYRRGTFPRVFVYDLKSAYPWALSTLPDPRNAEVVHSGHDELRRDALYSVYCVRVRIPESCGIPPIPKFVEGSSGNVLIYPCGVFKAWVTGPECALLRREGWLSKILHGIHLVGERRPWLTEIPSLFALRSSKPAISQAIKLVLNSIYGKFAQQRERFSDPGTVSTSTRRFNGNWVETRKAPGKTTNFFVAAYITALVRCRLWDSMKEVGFDNCLLAATDGLVTLRPLPGDMVGAGKLGDWVPSFRGAGSAVIVGTGVYSLRYDGAWHDKVRGFRPVQPLREMLSRRSSRIRVKNRIAYTLGDYALHGSELNDMVEVNRTLDVNFDVKRSWPRPWKRAGQLLSSAQGSKPLVVLE
jgi:hypothetical protein